MLKEIIDSNHSYFIEVYEFTTALKAGQSVLLSLLIQKDSMRNVDRIGNYFRCTNDFIKRNLMWSDTTISNNLNSLVKNGFIKKKVVYVNDKPNRFIKLNNSKILELYHSWVKSKNLME